MRAGAWGTSPAWKSNAAPTPTSTGVVSSARISAIHFSCLGTPIPIQATSAREPLISVMTARRSSSVSGRCGGEYPPTILIPG